MNHRIWAFTVYSVLFEAIVWGIFGYEVFILGYSGRCEMNRVHLATINPAYTSQKCSQCGEIHSESRVGELYSCNYCGLQLDADYNASLNIKHLFLSKEPTVPNDTKSVISFPNFD